MNDDWADAGSDAICWADHMADLEAAMWRSYYKWKEAKKSEAAARDEYRAAKRRYEEARE